MRTHGEIFTPPHLLKGPQPVIVEAPSRITYGASFTIETAPGPDIRRITLVRLGSVTHSFNMNQRVLKLVPSGANGIWNVTPPNGIGGVSIWDITNPEVPRLGRTVRNDRARARNLTVSSRHAYVSGASPRLQVLDLSDPSNPTLVGEFNTPGTALGVTVSGNDAYVADGEWGLQILRIEPEEPRLAAELVGNELRLTWPAFAEDYVIESTPGLILPDWQVRVIRAFFWGRYSCLNVPVRKNPEVQQPIRFLPPLSSE
jgi:hypothetical protein